jgi:hypothetical protein
MRPQNQGRHHLPICRIRQHGRRGVDLRHVRVITALVVREGAHTPPTERASGKHEYTTLKKVRGGTLALAHTTEMAGQNTALAKSEPRVCLWRAE